MKSKLFLFAISILLMQMSFNYLHGQSSAPKLDQLALMQQYNGNWNGSVWDNTFCRFTITLKNKGGEESFTYYTKEKELGTGKQIWYYDETADQILVAQLYDFKNFYIWKIKFIEPNKAICEISSNIKTESPSEKWSMEFLPTGEIRQTLISETRKVTYTYQKVN